MFWDKKEVVKEVIQYKVIEVPPRTVSPAEDKEMRESVATLSSHPGWVHQMKKLDYLQSALKHKLNHEKQSTLEEVQFLQAGIYWAGWLRQEQTRATTKLMPQQQDPMQDELEAFKLLDNMIERVGQE
jgi:hypothetical protein